MDTIERARRHAALGDPVRLAMVDDLTLSDRSPHELANRHGLTSNLLAHHLGVLERAELVERCRSAGDRRRRYVRLRNDALEDEAVGTSLPPGPVLFVCTHNSARSQLAAATWKDVTGVEAFSAGTHPADRIHPGAVAAAARAGLDLTGARPKQIPDVGVRPALVVTVCDRAHEELQPASTWWHWSIPDPAENPTPEAFDSVVDHLFSRISLLAKGTPA